MSIEPYTGPQQNVEMMEKIQGEKLRSAYGLAINLSSQLNGFLNYKVFHFSGFYLACV